MIRKANKDDISRIAEILVYSKRTAYRPIFHNDLVTFNQITVAGLLDEYHNHLGMLKNIYVWDDGIVKGVLHYQYTEPSLELLELYVDPFFIGVGIGGALLQHLIAKAKDCDVKRVYLWVIKDNVAARGFYEQYGFTPTGEERPVADTNVLEMLYERQL